MKIRIILFISFLFLIISAKAEVSFVTITNEESYSSVKDFTNTYEINLNKHGLEKIVKCQAVRLAKNWFITAAHCVEPCMNDTCSFQARLLVGTNYEADFTTTNGKDFSKKIFRFDKTRLDTKEILYDIALIYFDPKETKTVFKDPLRMHNITEAEFLRRIPNRAVYVRALNGTHLPTILVMNTRRPLAIKRNLSVISIWSGKKDILKNSDSTVFFSPKLSAVVTENFGVIQGISGSGVMTNTGELLGIVSATADLKSSLSSSSMHLLYISPFDEDIMNFILRYIPNVSYTVADRSFYRNLNDDEKITFKIIEDAKFNLNDKI
ncbi:MAG: hypothetical protein J5594_01490 [Elusimicrobiaceae bacterium]|nr:hypothetical protein [Elusimicrobiaceae bacterium]